MTYFGSAYMCLTVANTLFAWSSVGWAGHLILVPLVALSLVLPPSKPGPKSL